VGKNYQPEELNASMGFNLEVQYLHQAILILFVAIVRKHRAEFLVERADKKAIIFDMMIDVTEEEFNIPIRKKHVPELSNAIAQKNKKA